ncbi:putative wd repeat-containing protein 44 [Diaporthe ampelina]|uniref:Putative wd repeat-containing protein 44 n=1 Tax=Diaporthe ampelina TaxID=1214573 RepID=A0A0G2FF60_9PEZI|nr:putative wd repeat-containing protein 44 [Diaporthe ampelina]
MRTTRKARGDVDSIHDSESEFNDESRMDGADARVFSDIVDAGGFIPRHKEPPRYIRIRANNKKHHEREFNRMFLAQELVGTHPKLTGDDDAQAASKVPIVTVSVAGAGGRRRERTGGAIWATEFSKDGKYLAAAGKDTVVRMWAVISTHEERRAQEEEEAAICPVGERLSTPVFVERPFRELSGHANEILDLSWSKNNFLLSTSMDKSVRLWHTSRDECLCAFKHKDVVTKVAFHPTDDRFFLAGSLDMTLRLWSIPDKAVAYSVRLPDLITAVTFTPDGKLAIAGLLNGLCMVYDTEGLKFHSQIHAKSSRGKNSKGSKITGIKTMAMPLTSGGSGGTEPGEVKIMISTNDSRIRVYNLKDGSLDVKFKGHENACTQISASFSDDAQYVISGSENRKTFIWKVGAAAAGDSSKQPSESFDAHSDIVTTALFAPVKTRQLLSESGDPIYDLCNPPPVTLMPSDETAATSSQAAPSEADSQEKVQDLDSSLSTPGMVKKIEYSPAYLARKSHNGGNIIVTTDDQGIIKVFRQDCAFAKRRHESWETGSTFSRKPGGALSPGLVRSSSIRTRTSTGSAAHSRRGSLSNGAGQPGALPPGIAWGAPGTPKLSSDMILSWRQDIEGGGRPQSIAGSIGTPVRSERSISPGKDARPAASGSRANLAADARKQQYVMASPRIPAGANDPPGSPTNSVSSGRLRPKTANAVDAKKNPGSSPLHVANEEVTGADDNQLREESPQAKPRPSTARDRKSSKKAEEAPTPPPVPSFSFRSAEDGPEELRLDPAGASYGFWNLNRWKGLAGLRGSSGDGKSNVGGKGHQRTASDAVTPVAEDPEAFSDGPRRKSLAATRSSTMPLSPSPDTRPPVPGFQRRPADVQRDTSHLSTMTTHEEDRLAPADSVISKLSSELTSDSEDGDDVPCRKCGARKFRPKKIQGRQRLVCGRCGSVAYDESK